jgi:hypothetical protein
VSKVPFFISIDSVMNFGFEAAFARFRRKTLPAADYQFRLRGSKAKERSDRLQLTAGGLNA